MVKVNLKEKDEALRHEDAKIEDEAGDMMMVD